MKLIDTQTGTLVADIMTNHSMCIDEMLALMRITVLDDGQLHDEDDDVDLDAWYDDLDIVAE